MTFLEMVKITRQECGIQGQGASSVIGQFGLLKRLVDWVADADVLIQTMHTDWNFLWKVFKFPIVDGADIVVRPPNFTMWDRKSFAIDRGTPQGRSLRLIHYDEWRRNNNIKTKSEPYEIAIMPDNNLVLSAPSNGSHEIYAEYWKKPKRLILNDDVPLYAEEYHRMIIARAKMWFFEDIESIDQWNQAKEEYELWFKKLEGEYLPEQQEGSQINPEMMAVRVA